MSGCQPLSTDRQEIGEVRKYLSWAEVRPVSADRQGFQIADHARRRDQDGSILTPESFDSYGAGPVRLELSGIYPVDRAEEILLPDIYAIVAQDRVGSHQVEVDVRNRDLKQIVIGR